jgi:hypothetical protein
VSEEVFGIAQIGRQAGDFYAPGAAVAGAILYPVGEPITVDLDRASTYPSEDYGVNFDAHPTRGSHGNRGGSFDMTSEARFEDLGEILESHYTGEVTPTGGPTFTWVWDFAVGAPTIVPMTVRSGSETTQDQWAAVGSLVDELNLSFDDLDAPGHHPWMVDASMLCLDRESSALTADVDAPTSLESMLGHLSTISLGSTATAFASLTEITASLVSFGINTQRNLVLRPYGDDDSDLATGYGFSAKSSGEVTFKVKISATTKSVLHDAWNSSGAELDELRGRVTVNGSGSKLVHVDFRAGLTAVPVGTRDGERVYEVTGKLVRDGDAIPGPARISILNGVSALGSYVVGS